jgi:hypothetical protein
MPSLAKSPVAPTLGRRVPLRGPARLLFSSYARTRYQPQRSTRPGPPPSFRWSPWTRSAPTGGSR